MNKRPIGIYDSGIGGLTTAHAISRLLPHEDIVYFGDTAHLPYGEKPSQVICSYAASVIDFLLDKKCKAIVIACHSASSACYTRLSEYVYGDIQIINIIDPTIEYLKKNCSGKHVGIVGTQQTILSKIYDSEFDNTHDDIRVSGLATPSLAPMIEKEFFSHQIDHKIVKQYLSDPTLIGIERLVLACTHYSLIKKAISLFYKNRVPILDSSEILAAATANCLTQHGLLNSTDHKPSSAFFVSRCTSSFEAAVGHFFGQKAQLRQLEAIAK